MSDIIPENAPQNNLTPETTFIYVLIDPETSEIRYVGKADKPTRRLQGHLRPRDVSHKQHWINGLVRRGLKPLMQVIEEVPYDSWGERERYWIDYYLAQGCPLTNTATGGRGGNPSPETRAKIAAAHKGKKRGPRGPMSEEQKQKLSAAMKGRKPSPETVAKRAASRRGLKRSPETRAKMAAAQLGKKHTEERVAHNSEAQRKVMSNPDARAKRAAAQLGKKHTSETKAKVAAARVGSKHSPETIAKMSLARQQYWAMKNSSPLDNPTLWDQSL